MRNIYTINFENVSITNAAGDQELFYIAPADDRPVIVLGWELAQFSDVGDAAEEILRLRLIRGHTTVGSGGSSATPAALNRRGSAAGATCRVNDTTIASAGTAVNLWSGGFNIRAPQPYILPPEYRPSVDQTQGSIVLRLMAGPADDVTMSGTLWFEEP